MRRVQIDGESINSVGLEEEQHCNYRRLLVAFGVHLLQTRQVVSLRHTTLMPSIRGLPALIAMIFAPTIELRLINLKYYIKRKFFFLIDLMKKVK
jgi:hypothetical protein